MESESSAPAEIGPGTLKCVSAWSGDRPLRDVVEAVLRAHVRPADIRYLYGRIFLVYTEADAAAVRDWLIPHLREGESAFVVEFEQWAGYGPAPDRQWLLFRGH